MNRSDSVTRGHERSHSKQLWNKPQVKSLGTIRSVNAGPGVVQDGQAFES